MSAATGAEAFAAALFELDAELDWALLGRAYCSEGGDGFFSDVRRGQQREEGLVFASALGAELDEARAGGVSLYVGAAVFELTPMLAEALVFGRDVRALNLPGDEPEELNRALQRVEARLELRLPRVDVAPVDEVLADLPPVGHLWTTSVLTDPEEFPALHDELYGRRGTRLATGRGDLAAETEVAEALVGAVVGVLEPPALLTTTEDELRFFEAAARALGLRPASSREARISTVVGDPVRFVRLT